jgi:hypothetical protein
MPISTRLLMVAAFIATAAISKLAEAAPAGGGVASKATADKCKKVGDECLKSPLCLGGTTKQNCTTRCINKQASCLRSGTAAARSKEGRQGRPQARLRAPIAKPVVQQPTKTLAPKPILRGSRPGRNPK